MIQPTSSQAGVPAAPTTDAAAAERKAKFDKIKRQAAADPDVKAAFAAAGTAVKKANQMVSMKMSSLDPSIAPLLDQKRNQPVSSSDREKLANLRRKASADPQIKTELDLAKAAKNDAQKKFLAKIRELDPSPASTTGEKSQKTDKSGGKSGKKTGETPAPSGAGATSPSSTTNSTDKASPAE